MTWQRFALTRADCRPFLEKGSDLPRDRELVDPAPPWRRFMALEEYRATHAADAAERWRMLCEVHSERARQKAESFCLSASDQCRDLVLAVNAALALRRPLLLTGQPGSGKTTLAYVLADWLGLGPVLQWPVAPGALLADALATYNPLARLQDLETAQKENRDPLPVERFVRLGPVGTAFLPAPLPRVLLIDEIDKGDLNLANELLHLFEEGEFSIPELQRAERDRAERTSSKPQSRQAQPREAKRRVDTWDESQQGQPLQASILGGKVQCHEFPLVVMSSNGERDFPPAFNRRCLRVTMPDFSNEPETLRAIVQSHLERDGGTLDSVEVALNTFEQALEQQRLRGDVLATDQLLNLAYLMHGASSGDTVARLRTVLLQGLNSDTAPLRDGEG